MLLGPDQALAVETLVVVQVPDSCTPLLRLRSGGVGTAPVAVVGEDTAAVVGADIAAVVVGDNAVVAAVEDTDNLPLVGWAVSVWAEGDDHN